MWTMRIAALTAVLLSASNADAQIDQTKSPEQQIEEALSALPETMRENVQVEGFDEDGNLVVHREGTSHITCRADDPEVRAWVVSCYPKSLSAFVTRSRELTKNGADTPERIATLKREIESGALPMPAMAALYIRTGNSVASSSAVTVIHVPNASAQESGFPTLPTHGAPWLAEAGTVMANIRIAR